MGHKFPDGKPLSVFILASLCFLGSIVNLNTEAEEFDQFYIYGVPYVFQFDPRWCGPASLVMVLNYWGLNKTLEEVAARVYDPALAGTMIWDMRDYVRELSFHIEETFGSLEHLKKCVRKGRPVIVAHHWLNWKSHFRVVVGYDDENEIIITTRLLGGTTICHIAILRSYGCPCLIGP